MNQVLIKDRGTRATLEHILLPLTVGLHNGPRYDVYIVTVAR